MNSCVLMAEIVQAPQLRYTTDQMAIAEMLVQFPGLRTEDPPATLKVVGWGNLAQEIQQNYHQGDRVIIEGRLSMNTVERPEGFKEKRAELTVQRMHSLGEGFNISASAQSTANTSNTTDVGAVPSRTPPPMEERVGAVGVKSQPNSAAPKPQPPPLPTTDADVDDIPF